MEAEISRTSYTWEDKYRPRKPRYFNKVHTGYEWNKYNQTHYEYVPFPLPFPRRWTADAFPLSSPAAPTTPLPRSSRATSSTSSTPTCSTRRKPLVRPLSPPFPLPPNSPPLPCAEYRIVKNKENPDICQILFTSGPPYEDLAFTIVNRPWEHSHKRGFRSSFDRGVLQLHFSFRRNFYRSTFLFFLLSFVVKGR